MRARYIRTSSSEVTVPALSASSQSVVPVLPSLFADFGMRSRFAGLFALGLEPKALLHDCLDRSTEARHERAMISIQRVERRIVERYSPSKQETEVLSSWRRWHSR